MWACANGARVEVPESTVGDIFMVEDNQGRDKVVKGEQCSPEERVGT